MANKKIRLDLLMVEQGLTETRSKAQSLIMAGDVSVNGRRIDKSGTLLPHDTVVEVRRKSPFVSRGGEKLYGALVDFSYDVNQLTCADVGASTGGFTDCLLQHGAKKVYAIDVGYGQLAHKLRIDDRVIVMERKNARYIESLDEPIDLVVIDASFISLRLLLPNVQQWLKQSGDVIALIKPQFEAGKKDVGKGGVVRDSQIHQAVIEELSLFADKLGFKTHQLTVSPLKGPSGNVEFLIWLTMKTRLAPINLQMWFETYFSQKNKP